MSIYDNNIELLKENNHSLYKALMEAEEKLSKPRIDVYERTALNGEPVLEVEKNGEVTRLNSLYNPSHEAKIWSEQFERVSLQDVYVLFGFGNGNFVRALTERMEDGRIIIIYEPSYEIFQFVLEHYDLTDLLKDPTICIVVRDINDFDFVKLLNYIVTWNNLSAQTFVAINGYQRLFNLEFVVALNHVKENVNKIMTKRNTTILFGKTFTFNSIENSAFVYQANNVTDFVGVIPNDLTAIIVAAGPSLDKNVKELKKAKGKAIIISVDRALDTLIANDIMPDFSVTIDPQKAPRFYDNPITWEIPMFYPLAANREIISRHTGPKIVFSPNTISNEYYRRLGVKFDGNSPGGSVATAAFTIARTLGLKNIVLVGQDLAYHEGYTHAGGIKLSEKVNVNNLVKVKGIHGEELYTGWDMYNYIIWYQESIQMYQDEIQVIDATEGGALIRGTKIMTLEEAINNYCNGSFDVNELLRECSITNVEERYQVLLQLYLDLVEELKKLAVQSKKAEQYCNDLMANVITYGGLNNKGLQIAKQLSKLNSEMNELTSAEFIESYVSDVSLDKLRHINEIKNEEIEDQKKTFEISRAIYEANKKACQEILEYMEPFVESFKKR